MSIPFLFCGRTACQAPIGDDAFFLIKNDTGGRSRSYCVTCGRSIVEANPGIEHIIAAPTVRPGRKALPTVVSSTSPPVKSYLPTGDTDERPGHNQGEKASVGQHAGSNTPQTTNSHD